MEYDIGVRKSLKDLEVFITSGLQTRKVDISEKILTSGENKFTQQAKGKEMNIEQAVVELRADEELRLKRIMKMPWALTPPTEKEKLDSWYQSLGPSFGQEQTCSPTVNMKRKLLSLRVIVWQGWKLTMRRSPLLCFRE